MNTFKTKQELRKALETINSAIVAIREELHWENEYSSRIELVARQNYLLAEEKRIQTALAAM